MSDVIFRVAAEDRGAFDDDPDSLSVSNEYPSLKIKNNVPPHFDTLEFTFDSEPAVGITNILKIPHGYTFMPMTIGQFSFDKETFYLMPMGYDVDLMSGSLKQLRCYTDATYFYIDFRREGVGNSAMGTYFFKYSIYADFNIYV